MPWSIARGKYSGRPWNGYARGTRCSSTQRRVWKYARSKPYPSTASQLIVGWYGLPVRSGTIFAHSARGSRAIANPMPMYVRKMCGCPGPRSSSRARPGRPGRIASPTTQAMVAPS